MYFKTFPAKVGKVLFFMKVRIESWNLPGFLEWEGFFQLDYAISVLTRIFHRRERRERGVGLY